jgi:hypothetical protein
MSVLSRALMAEDSRSGSRVCLDSTTPPGRTPANPISHSHPGRDETSWKRLQASSNAFRVLCVSVRKLDRNGGAGR